MLGEEVRRLREAADFTLGQLAIRVDSSKSHLSNVECGARQPSLELLRRLDRVLGASGYLIAMGSASQRDGGPRTAGAPSLEDVWQLRMSPEGESSLSTAQALLRTVPPAFPVATDDGLSGFRDLLAHMRRLAQMFSPAVISPMVIAQLSSLRVMAICAPGTPTEHAAYRLAARFADFAGWMAQENGDDPAALWWIDQAVQLATLGADKELPAYALVRRAELALYHDDSVSVVDLARSAHDTATTNRVRFLAAQREAQGYALAGIEHDFKDALTRAAKFGETLADDKELEPRLGSTMDDSFLFVSAWCLHDIGRAEEAVDVLQNVIHRLPPQAYRVRARYGARLVLALMSAGQFERACRVADEVAEATKRSDSATARADLRQFLRSIKRRHTEPAIKELMPALRGALQANRVHR